MNREITTSEIELVIKKVSKNISLELDGFKGELHETFKEKVVPILFKEF